MSRHRRLLGFAVASQMFAWTGAALFIPIIPLYLRSLHATDVEIGYYSASTLVSLAFGPMLIGWLSDRRGVRDRLVVLCLAFQAPVAYAMAFTDSLLVACLLNICLWTFGASSINLTRAIVALIFSAADRDRAFARLAITSPLSFILGGLAGGRIVESLGYPGLFKVMAAFWLLSALAAVGIREDRDRPKDEVAGGAVWSRALILFCVASLLQSLSFQWSEIAFPLHMNNLGFSLPFITSMHAVSSLVSIPFVILAARYAARVGNINLLIGGLLLFSGCRFALSIAETQVQVIGIQVFAGIPAAFTHSIAAAVMAGLGPDRFVGSRMSLLMMCVGIGGAIGGTIGGHLLAAFGAAGLLVCAGTSFVLTATFMRLFVVDPDRVRREDVIVA